MQFAVASAPISSNPFLDNFWFAGHPPSSSDTAILVLSRAEIS